MPTRSNLIFQIETYMGAYRHNKRNTLSKQAAERLAGEARRKGCNSAAIAKALGRSGGGGGGGAGSSGGGGSGGGGYCECVDENGRRYNVPMGLPCDMEGAWGRNYDCD